MSARPVSLFGPSAVSASGAVFNADRRYRYALERRWGGGPFVLFVGLNPSTADEHADDATIRVCRGYAKRWGMGGLLMGNLFAWRATDPRKVPRSPEAVGPDCDVWLTTMACRSALVVAAWGADRLATPERVAHAREALGCDLMVLGITASGAPWHPLYKRADLVPQLWSP